jgi:hypothetical protein
MYARKIIGWSLIGFVFLLLFAGTVATHGLAAAVVSWGVAILMCVVFVVGVWLTF